MSCCFMFYSYKPMDSASTDIKSSVTDYLEKDRLCQEICKTITKSVEEGSVQSGCPFPSEAASVLPDLNSDDDVEDILQQISDLLGSHLGDNSQCTDIDGVDDLSVDEILKQAEQIVRASTPYFEKKTTSITCLGAEPILEPIRKNAQQSIRRSHEIDQIHSNHQVIENKTIVISGRSNVPAGSSDLPSTTDIPNDKTTGEVSGIAVDTISTNNELKIPPSGKCNDRTVSNQIEVSPTTTKHCSNILNCENGPLTILDLAVLPEVVDSISKEDSGANVPDDCSIVQNVQKTPTACIEIDDIDCVVSDVQRCLNCLEDSVIPIESQLNSEKPKESNKDQLSNRVDCSKYFDGDEKAQVKQNWPDGLDPSIDKNTSKIAVSDSSSGCYVDEHETTISELKSQVKALTFKIAEYEKFEQRTRKNEALALAERQRIRVLEEEIRSQGELIVGYQLENQRLSSDILSAKESWKATEVQLVDKVLELEKRFSLSVANSFKEKDELNRHLKQAYELVKKLEAELERSKKEKIDLRKINDDLTVEVTKLNCELDEYKKDHEVWNKNENDKLALMESNAIIQSKLSQVNTEVTRKQTEIIRLNGEIGRLRGELEKIRLGSVMNNTNDTATTVTQLQAALAMERDNCCEIAKERDCLNNEVKDLRRQVALLDNSNYGERGERVNKNEAKEAMSHNQIAAKLEATRYKIESEQNQKRYDNLQTKYDCDIMELGQQIKKLQKENLSLKHLLNDQAKQQPRKALASKLKEETHLLATIRGLQGELSAREKDVSRLNKELGDARKTNRRLQQEREKALTSSSKMRGSQYTKESEAIGASRPNSECSSQSAKDYNPLTFEDNQEALIFLKNENRTMLEEIKRLEQDLISLHNKRIQDMSDLQEQHDREINSMRREHSTKHSSSTMTHLQGQLYTQQMVIHHLKQQIKEYEERVEEFSIMRAERNQFERALMTANQKLARLNELSSPENLQYAGLLEKLEYLERRHEIREEKLQSIVKDLVAKQRKGTCSDNCKDKILNKNREICYYRAEMDKILAALAEFRWN